MGFDFFRGMSSNLNSFFFGAAQGNLKYLKNFVKKKTELVLFGRFILLKFI